MGLRVDRVSAHYFRNSNIISFDDTDDGLTTDMLTAVLMYPMRLPPLLTSEEGVATHAYNLTGAVWLALSELDWDVPFEHARNRVESSGATGRGLRPDYCVWTNGTLIFEAEHKADAQQLDEAKEELVAKMTGGWNELALHGLPFLPCLVAAGPMMQFCAVFPPAQAGRDALLAEVTNQYDTSSAWGQLHVLRSTLNMARVMSTLRTLVRGRHVPLYKRMRRTAGSEIMFMNDHVLKKCKPANCAVYRCLSGADAVPHSVRVTVLGASNTFVILRIEPICKPQALPANETELREAIRSVLTALRALHARGFVHRDVRWPNVLQTVQGQWLLADFELADVADAELPADAVAPASLPPEGRCYKFAGDIYRVGKLVSEWSAESYISTTDVARTFADLLSNPEPNDRPTAAASLSHAWLARISLSESDD